VEAESSKAVNELALFTKKAARSQASQEYNLKCEQERADELKHELDHTNAEMLVLMTETKKGMSSRKPFSIPLRANPNTHYP
jgi:hypothetical protein